MTIQKKLGIAGVLLAIAPCLLAEEAAAKKPKHMVDMADGMNSREFYESQNPNALWSSELKTPWAKSSAINAYDDKPAAGQDKQAAGKEAANAGSTAALPSSEPVGSVNGKKVDADQLINIRVMYTLDGEHSKASFSPVSAQNELFRQMSKTCVSGFQKIAEWSEPANAETSDYYLYYQFKCMEKR